MEKVVADAARFLATRAGEPVTLGDVADHVGYSPFHLARCFERHLGVPPGQYLAAHRFQRAKQLLLSGDDRIIDICFQVGFSSVGTFTTRFAAAVGSTPQQFRRLPELLATMPPRPLHRPGTARDGGSVTGTVQLSRPAAAALAGPTSVYVGLFPRRSARGIPVAGAMLWESRHFLLTGVPAGTYWVLAAALPAHAEALAQLLPDHRVTGVAAAPVRVTAADRLHYRDVQLDLSPEWAPPVVVALPALASTPAQQWRRSG